LLAYARKFAAENQDGATEVFGLPNFITSSASEPTVWISLQGPHLKVPAKAPIEVETAGTTFVRSFSVTKTPGDS
jgi:hypothetical protein